MHSTNSIVLPVRQFRRNLAKATAAAAFLLAVSPGASFAQTQTVNAKEVAKAFFELAFVQGHVTEAALKYISPTRYIQHNPMVADGRDAFLQTIPALVKASGRRAEIKRIVAEGDLVVVHARTTVPGKPEEAARAVMDIFRIENGLIVEHWDTIQEVPATTANGNGMF